MAVEQNKYLTFALGDETFGMPILQVKEIIGMMPVTQVPRMPPFIRGVINLRGKIIPVVDLRRKFDMPDRPYDDRTCIIVVDMPVGDKSGESPMQNGFVVDTVSEVLAIPSEQVEPPPRVRSAEEQQYLLGLGKVKDKVILLMSAEHVLSRQELDMVDAIPL